jgi:hypothetical protein
MPHGLFNLSRDFQISEVMQWHKLTTLAKPARAMIPEIVSMPLYYNGGKDMVYGSRKFVVPVSKDDMLPVAPPYCGETVIDESVPGCEDIKADARRGSYSLFTPREAWDWVAEVLAGTGYTVESIGMLWNRSFWFISTSLDELKATAVGDGRETMFQLNFSGGLDRTVSPQCELSSVVAVCHNTISLSRASGKVLFRERATKGFADRLEASKGEVESAVGMAAVFRAAMNTAAATPCNRERAERVFAGFITPPASALMSSRGRNTVGELGRLHVGGIGNQGSTEWDMLNAYTQYRTHGAADSKTPLGRRFASSEFGTAADTKAEFYNFLVTRRHNGVDIDKVEERGAKLLAAPVAS